MPDSEKNISETPKKRPTVKRRKRTQATEPSTRTAPAHTKAPSAAHHAAMVATPATPSRPAPVLLKTTYNTARVRLAIVAGATVLSLGIGFVLWSQWDRLTALWQQAVPTKSVSVLHVDPEDLDGTKQGAAQQATGAFTFASASAQASSPANFSPKSGDEWPAIPAADTLAGYSTAELVAVLERQIAVLKAEGEDTRLLEKLKRKGTKSDLLKGIQLGKEYQALYLYYRK